MNITDFQFNSAWQPKRRYPSRYKFFFHKHTFYELGIVVSGKCKWHFRNRRTAIVNCNHGIIVAPHEPHMEELMTSCDLAWIRFMVPESEIHSIKLHRPISLDKHFAEILSIFEKLETENILHPKEDDLRMQLLIAELMLLLRRSVSEISSKKPPIDYNTRVIESAALYLERNCTENLTLQQVARYHGLSHSHFGALFREHFGMSPKTFQQLAKLKRLENSIAAGVTQIKSLVEEGQFEDAAYFCRWIKRMTGLRPKEWLRKSREN